MAHTHHCLLAHLVFSTKERRPWLDDELRPDLFAYLGGIARALDTVALGINGPDNHVHLLLSYAPRHALSDLTRELKTRSSAWLKRERAPGSHRGFAWQGGFSVFAVSRSGQEKVLAYIAGQVEHHRTVTFEEELLALLKKHGIAYDERFVFD